MENVCSQRLSCVTTLPPGIPPLDVPPPPLASQQQAIYPLLPHSASFLPTDVSLPPPIASLLPTDVSLPPPIASHIPTVLSIPPPTVHLPPTDVSFPPPFLMMPPPLLADTTRPPPQSLVSVPPPSIAFNFPPPRLPEYASHMSYSAQTDWPEQAPLTQASTDHLDQLNHQYSESGGLSPFLNSTSKNDRRRREEYLRRSPSRESERHHSQRSSPERSSSKYSSRRRSRERSFNRKPTRERSSERRCERKRSPARSRYSERDKLRMTERCDPKRRSQSWHLTRSPTQDRHSRNKGNMSDREKILQEYRKDYCKSVEEIEAKIKSDARYENAKVSTWYRSSPAEVYYSAGERVGIVSQSAKLAELCSTFHTMLIERGRRARPEQDELPPLKPQEPKLCKHRLEEASSSSSSSEEEGALDEEGLEGEADRVMQELQRKQSHPRRLHPEMWYNHTGEMNGGPLCRCNTRARRLGMRHGVFADEPSFPRCDLTSSNLDKLHHYRITVSPATNFLIKTPTIISHDEHEFLFSGFSMFSHYKLPEIPMCKVIRFNIEYTILFVEEQAPQNFTIQELDLFEEYLFTEILELVDLDLGKASGENCSQFHFMPRFVRSLRDGGSEVLSMCEVLNYLLIENGLLIPPSELKNIHKMDHYTWQKFIDKFQGMIVTYPGKKPCSIRVDQLDRNRPEVQRDRGQSRKRRETDMPAARSNKIDDSSKVENSIKHYKLDSIEKKCGDHNQSELTQNVKNINLEDDNDNNMRASKRSDSSQSYSDSQQRCSGKETRHNNLGFNDRDSRKISKDEGRDCTGNRKDELSKTENCNENYELDNIGQKCGHSNQSEMTQNVNERVLHDDDNDTRASRQSYSNQRRSDSSHRRSDSSHRRSDSEQRCSSKESHRKDRRSNHRDSRKRSKDDRRDLKETYNFFPEIVHFGIRPPQLSYAGNPEYQKVWRFYLKYRHLIANMSKPTFKDKQKLQETEAKLQEIRTQSKMKRDVTVAVSSQGFYTTGLMCDVVQHAMLIPVLVRHLRFHKSLDSLEERIKYKFQSRAMLQKALTHPSYRENFGTNPDHARNSLTNCGIRQPEYGDRKIHYTHTRKKGINILINIMSRFGEESEKESSINHNERLEFLGDAVVEFVSSVHLFLMFPGVAEGGLATYRAAIVQNQHLALLAKKIGLDKFMLIAHGSDLCRDIVMRHAMANCFEALMGAVYLDGGLKAADDVFALALWLSESLMMGTWTRRRMHPLQEQEPLGDRQYIKDFDFLQKLVNLEDAIGIRFKHIRLLARAFTDRSVGFTHLTLGSNQRLEFLGDTVLQLVVSERLYRHFPGHHEGHLSLLRSSLVNNRTQSIICDDLGMADYAVYNNPKAKPSTKKHKADLLEAFLGALYLDKGLQYCEVFCNVVLFPRLEKFITNQDWNDPKSKLQQCCLTLRSIEGGEPDIPIYKVIESLGPTNTRMYTVAVYFCGIRLAKATGLSIQEAEMNAAKEALAVAHKKFPQLDHQKRVISKIKKDTPKHGDYKALMKKNSQVTKIYKNANVFTACTEEDEDEGALSNESVASSDEPAEKDSPKIDYRSVNVTSLVEDMQDLKEHFIKKNKYDSLRKVVKPNMSESDSE